MSSSLLLTAFDQAYNRQSWHGTNLRGSIRGMTLEIAARRPAPGRHNIWELVVHCAYWKYVVWRRLTGEKRGSFRLEGSNFFERPVEMTEHAWRADVRLLEEMHQRLRRIVVAMRPRELTMKRHGKFTAADLISGITAHDLYHAGQIQLLKRLL
jgi:uncharacterized damage-inducible protein DinB